MTRACCSCLFIVVAGVAPLAGSIAEVNGTRLYYEVQGQGQPVGLLHGGMLDSRMWDDQFPIFARQYKTIRYDIRRFGRSAIPTSGYSAADDLHALLKFLEIDRPVLVGLSVGWRIAIDFAVEHPDMLRALVLLAPGLSGYRGADDSNQRFWDRVVAARDEGPAKAVELWLKDPFMAPAMENPAVAAKIRPIAMANSHVFLVNPFFERDLKPPAIDRLANIRAPTLIVVGDRDVRSIESIAGILDVHIVGSKKVIIRGSGHMINMEKPEDLNRVVLDFLTTLAAVLP